MAHKFAEQTMTDQPPARFVVQPENNMNLYSWRVWDMKRSKAVSFTATQQEAEGVCKRYNADPHHAEKEG